jgi:hypothetical protein
MLNRSKVELLGRAAADVAKSATEVLGLHNELRYAEQQVELDEWHPAAAHLAKANLEVAEGMLRGLVEVLKLQIGALE